MNFELLAIPLDQLRPGHEGKPPINVRHTDTDVEIADLAASLRAHGMVQRLVVQYQGKVPFVADGQRRLAAQTLRAAEGEIKTTDPQDCIIVPEGVDAHEISLALSVSPVPAHPADQYEAFSRLARATPKGSDPAQAIMARFGATEKAVRQTLALGNLSPAVLDAWRKGKIDRAGVQAFTLAKDPKDQERVLKKLKGSAGDWQIRRELGLERGDALSHVSFVGREAYEAAGGVIREDLFGQDHVIQNPDIAKKLSDEILDAKAAALIADGWGWAVKESDLGQTERHSLPVDYDISRSGAKTSKVLRAKYGCVVKIGHDSKLAVEYGKLKKGQSVKKAAAKKVAAGEPEASPMITNALAIRMSEQLTRGAKAAILLDPHAAMAALLAGLLCRDGPVDVQPHGFESAIGQDEGFGQTFEGFLKKTDAELVLDLAPVVADLLDLTVYNAQSPLLGNPGERTHAGTLLDGIKPVKGKLTVSGFIREKFDIEDYLKSAPRALKLRAIADISPGEAVKSADRLKGADLAKRAIAMVTVGEGAKWLPEELRTTDYAGPSGKPAAKEPRAAKKPVKKVVTKKRK